MMKVRLLIFFPVIACLTCLEALARQVELVDSVGLRTGANSSVQELLRGSTPGVRVSSLDGSLTGPYTVDIRGLNSFRGDNQPLWIIDGVMVSTNVNNSNDAFFQYGGKSYTLPVNPLAFLNANDIESITVLKNLSATSMYGDKGANGVIVINTKIPSDSGRRIKLRSNLGFSNQNGKYSFDHNHYLQLGGDMKASRYNLSLSLRSTGGYLENDRSTYGTLKANYASHSGKVFHFGFNTLLSYGQGSSPKTVNYVWNSSATNAGSESENWAADYDGISKEFRALASTDLKFIFLPSLYLKLSGGLDYSQMERVYWYGVSLPLGMPSPTNQYGGAASNISAQTFSYNAEALLNFDRYFAVKHHFSANARFSVYSDNDGFNTINGQNFVSHSKRGYSINIGAFDIFNNAVIHKYFHLGGSAAVAYDYDGIFGANASFRIDKTPRYTAMAPNIYPSAEAFWDIRKSFFKESDKLSELRVDGGWGKSGKTMSIPYFWLDNYLTTPLDIAPTGAEAFYESVDNLIADEWHVGICAGFLANRLEVGINYFMRFNKDEITTYKMGHPSNNPNTTSWVWGGCENVFSRMSGICNKGYEFSLTVIPIKTDAWKWSINANLTMQSNTMTSVADGDKYGKSVGSSAICNYNAYYMPVASLIGYQTNSDGSLKDQTGEGVVDFSDKVIIGTTLPKLYGGLRTDLSYRNITFELSLDGSYGNVMADFADVKKQDIKDSDGNIVLTDLSVKDAGFLRISDIGLKYRIPVKSRVIKSLDTFFMCHNPYVASAGALTNPDSNNFRTNAFRFGVEYGSMYYTRMFLVGASITF